MQSILYNVLVRLIFRSISLETICICLIYILGKGNDGSIPIHVPVAVLKPKDYTLCAIACKHCRNSIDKLVNSFFKLRQFHKKECQSMAVRHQSLEIVCRCTIEINRMPLNNLNSGD
jgi:hypothetical protein